ncbi:MAG: hypothetical protein K0U98_08205 [Deltaproteobacteria bacterium]|nr:hypothetical protein [Deltaproteobacteria bacterium]
MPQLPVITAITAPPPWPNAGMASVDLALYDLCRRHQLEAEVRFVQLYSSEERLPELPEPIRQDFLRRQRLPFAYTPFRDRLEELYASDVILYWGDFLHAFGYHSQVAAILVDLGLEPTLEAAAETVRQHFLLTEAPREALSRTLAFGGTLVFNRDRDYRHPDYGPALGRFVDASRRIWMRDVYSALRVRELGDSHPGDSRPGGSGQRNLSRPFPLGVDASLLLRQDCVAALPGALESAPSQAPAAGVFFGRTRRDVAPLAAFARDLCAALDTPAEWLSWLDPRTPPALLGPTLESFPALTAPQDLAPPVGELLSRLSQYRFVVTDTYHVCLNAWRCGVPAICLGDALATQQSFDCSLGWSHAWRDKRHVFYAMHDAMEYYVASEELADPELAQRRLQHTKELLQDAPSAASVTASIRRRRDTVEQELVQELRILLNPGAPGKATTRATTSAGDTAEPRRP